MKTFIELNLQTHPSNRFFCFSLLFFALSVFRCEDEKPKTELEKLPPATQEGKGTFGCLVNGKAWVTQNRLSAQRDQADSLLFITAGITKAGQNQQIRFDIVDADRTPKEYTLSDSPRRFAVFLSRPSSCRYKTISGKLIITGRGIVAKPYLSGRFEFFAYSSECRDSLKVTDGRFDIY